MSEGPTVHELFAALERIERRERFVSGRLEVISERVAAFPNEVSQRQQAEFAAEQAELRKQIASLRERLNVA
jgi:ABC-type phosphate transport system auxiliary subunit